MKIKTVNTAKAADGKFSKLGSSGADFTCPSSQEYIATEKQRMNAKLHGLNKQPALVFPDPQGSLLTLNSRL